jgi:hypothetical protein
MPIAGVRETKTIGNSYRKSPLAAYAKAFTECAQSIMKEDGYDIFLEPQKVYHRRDSKEAMKRFFVENCFDESNPMLDSDDREDLYEQAEAQFNNDVDALMEHSAPADYNPIVGMALPIHKLILMNNVYDKGVLQKVTAVQPKFTISLERRLLVTPEGEEIDMFLQQNEMTAAIDATNPVHDVVLSLPVTEDYDIITDEFGGTSQDNLDISTYISAVKVSNVLFEVGDILPDEDGYINKDGKTALEEETHDVWFRTDIRFAPNYGGPNRYERTVTTPLQITYKDAANGGAVTVKKAIITGSMNKNRFNIADLAGAISEIKLSAKLDSSNAMLNTVTTKWKVDTDLVEIGNAIPINTTISPEEVKDLSAMYNVNQLTKTLELIKTVLGNYKDDKIKSFIDETYNRLDERTSFYDTFDFAPRDEYALSHVEWRQATFMDFLDDFATKMLQVLNDPNMTISIVGDPRIVRKICPKEYAYTAPGNVGPVTLDYTQVITNITDKRLYNFVGSDKMRNTNSLMIILNPRNSERICMRIYDYQLYISNEIRNIQNPALPAIHAFERFKTVAYMPVIGKVDILNSSGLRPAE